MAVTLSCIFSWIHPSIYWNVRLRQIWKRAGLSSLIARISVSANCFSLMFPAKNFWSRKDGLLARGSKAVRWFFTWFLHAYWHSWILSFSFLLSLFTNVYLIVYRLCAFPSASFIYYLDFVVLYLICTKVDRASVSQMSARDSWTTGPSLSGWKRECDWGRHSTLTRLWRLRTPSSRPSNASAPKGSKEVLWWEKNK